MEEIAISEFKAKCLAILAHVEKTKEPVRITRHGKPVAEVIPAVQTVDRAAWIGSLKGEIKILGDIVSPVIDLDEIEALSN
ncbi:MAG: type II toxin-antitoxin system Phd/YefM family antitoxin [Candidatus Acidiferrum sp.]